MQDSEKWQVILERHLTDLTFDSEGPERLYHPIRYILEDGGKRIRPILCLIACDIYGDRGERAMNAALAIEIFHNFTLLHDDIMDKAELRRGRPAAYLKWGESGAILSGDAMLILAYEILCAGDDNEAYLPHLLAIFNRAAMEVCQGQQYDMDFETRDERGGEKVTRPEYIDMIRLKTSVLLAAALEMGGLIGGADESQRKALYEFGVNLGIAFQIQDDYLDTYGSTDTFGKNIGGDITVGKKTFLHITALEKAVTEQQVAEILRPGQPAEKIARVKEIYDRLGVPALTEQAIKSYFDRAMEFLPAIHPDEHRRNELKKYAYSLMNRTK